MGLISKEIQGFQKSKYIEGSLNVVIAGNNVL
jgi:hypothetical protein